MQSERDTATTAVALIVIVAALLGWVGFVPAPLPWDFDPRAALPTIHALKVLALLMCFSAVTAFSRRTNAVSGFGQLGISALVALVAVVARVLNHQSNIHRLGLPDECVALGLGLVANHVFSSDTLRQPSRPEPWLKLGVTLLGAEVLMPRMLALGVPGLVVIASVTPIVIVLVWIVGTRLLRTGASARLLLLSVATAVGGVTAVMMASVATRARRAELGFTLVATGAITVALIHLLPALAAHFHIDAYVAGAWLGGTFDTGDVKLAAIALNNPNAAVLASKLALVQHSMLGFLALVLSVYWLVSHTHNRGPTDASTSKLSLPTPVIGMLLASVVSSFVLSRLLGPDAMQELVGVTSELRAWCFAVGAAALGMGVPASEIRSEADHRRSLTLIVVGVTVDATLTLLLAHLVLGRGLASGAP